MRDDGLGRFRKLVPTLWFCSDHWSLAYLHATKTHIIHIKWGIGENVIERTEAGMKIVVVGVSFFDFTAQAVHPKVHLGEVHSFECPFLPINARCFRRWGLAITSLCRPPVGWR